MRLREGFGSWVEVFEGPEDGRCGAAGGFVEEGHGDEEPEGLVPEFFLDQAEVMGGCGRYGAGGGALRRAWGGCGFVGSGWFGR